MDRTTAIELSEGFNLMVEERLIKSALSYVGQDIAGVWYVGIKHDGFTSMFFSAFSLYREVHNITRKEITTRMVEAIRNA